jgi:hypothetical protein
MIEGVNHIPEGALGFADKRSETDLSQFFTLSKPRKFTIIPALEDAHFFTSQKRGPIAPDDD